MLTVDNSNRSIATWAFIASVIFAVFSTLFLYSKSVYVQLGAEDSLIENLTAAFYALAGALLVWAGILGKRARSKGVLTVLLGLFLLFVAGEEISWGQSVFYWQTPDFFQEINRQQETNLHNISSWFNEKPRALVELWMVTAGLIIPVFFALKGKGSIKQTAESIHWLYPGNLGIWEFGNFDSDLLLLFENN